MKTCVIIGDGGLMDLFAETINNFEKDGQIVDKWMFEAHKLAFEAENARVNGINK